MVGLQIVHIVKGDSLHPQDPAVADLQLGHGDLPAEAGSSAAARIQPQPSVDPLLAVHMGVSADHSVHTLQSSGHIPPVMGHEEGNATNLETQNSLQVPDPRHESVAVSPYRVNIPIQAQFVQVRLPDDIARVQNVFAVLKLMNHRPPQQAMAVRQHSNPDDLLIHHSQLSFPRRLR